MLDTSQVPPPKPWERVSSLPRGNAEKQIVSQVEKCETGTRGRSSVSTGLIEPATSQLDVVSSVKSDGAVAVVGPADMGGEGAQTGYDVDSSHRSYSRGLTAVDAYNSNANVWNASHLQRNAEVYGGSHYYTPSRTGNYYGNLGFGTSNPLYASSYGTYRNGLSLSPYSSSALYFPSSSVGGSSGTSAVPFSYSFLQETAEGLGRVSLLLDLNGCFLDRLCDHSSNLLFRLNSLSASFSQLRTYLSSTVKHRCSRACEAVSHLKSKCLFPDFQDPFALAVPGASSAFLPDSTPVPLEKPPSLLPRFLSRYVCAVLTVESWEKTRNSRAALLRFLSRRNVVHYAFVEKQNFRGTTREKSAKNPQRPLTQRGRDSRRDASVRRKEKSAKRESLGGRLGSGEERMLCEPPEKVNNAQDLDTERQRKRGKEDPDVWATSLRQSRDIPTGQDIQDAQEETRRLWRELKQTILELRIYGSIFFILFFLLTRRLGSRLAAGTSGRNSFGLLLSTLLTTTLLGATLRIFSSLKDRRSRRKLKEDFVQRFKRLIQYFSVSKIPMG
ncbi:putative transmembrane protein [Toxoplasma gondii VEG]|uniref:Transmembrane protein n=1 Tax=Toxoplasma gondii (strain ATCC 50861 / VEG) TaxID=432359 RepID=V4ZEM7_TOXGV|nr:putative transmembrane protein [Toxoplasma gondii VEG]